MVMPLLERLSEKGVASVWKSVSFAAIVVFAIFVGIQGRRTMGMVEWDEEARAPVRHI